MPGPGPVQGVVNNPPNPDHAVGTTASDTELLDAASAGDERAFRALVEPHRRSLHAHCYRMLGSAHDADDALQDTMLRAWKGLARFAGRSSLRTWLHTIAHNVCLSALRRRPRRPLPVDLGPSADPSAIDWSATEGGWLEPYPDLSLERTEPGARYEARESVELAFVAALQHLPPNQRASLVLRDVLGFSAREAADALGTTVASVTSALQRARISVRDRQPERSQRAELGALGDVGRRALVERYVDAWQRGDPDAIVALLADDAVFSMPPHRAWFRGRQDIAAMLPGPLATQWRLVPVGANGQLAFGCYAWDPTERRHAAHSLDVVTVRDGRIAAITAFLDAEMLSRFGLPDELPGFDTLLGSARPDARR